MKASEIIEKLQQLINEHGDLIVEFPSYYDDDCGFLSVNSITPYYEDGMDLHFSDKKANSFTIFD